jgi:hypothetical protein
MIKIEITIDDEKATIEKVVRGLKYSGPLKQVTLTDIPEPVPVKADPVESPVTQYKKDYEKAIPVPAEPVKDAPAFVMPSRIGGQSDNGFKQMWQQAVRDYYNTYRVAPPGFTAVPVSNDKGYRLMRNEKVRKRKCQFCHGLFHPAGIKTHEATCRKHVPDTTYKQKEKPLVSVFEGSVDKTVKTYPDNASVLRDN